MKNLMIPDGAGAGLFVSFDKDIGLTLTIVRDEVVHKITFTGTDASLAAYDLAEYFTKVDKHINKEFL